MPTDEPDRSSPPTIPYSSISTPVAIGDQHLAMTRAWRALTAAGVVVLVAAFVVSHVLGLVALVFTVSAGLTTLVYMTRYAARHLGTGYAVRHLVLAVLLSPFLLAGVFLVSLLVEAEVERHCRLGERVVEDDPDPGTG